MKNRKKHIKLIAYTWVLLTSVSLIAQQVCENTKQRITLGNNIDVFLFKEISSHRIYYLPTTLQLSENKGRPEFSYQEYTDQEKTASKGAILHFLITWGLNKKQTGELVMHIKRLYGENATLGGALHLEAAASDFTISNTSKIGKILNAYFKNKGSPPTTSSGKMAVSFHIKGENIALTTEAFTKPAKLSGTIISINYRYKTYSCNGGVNVAKNNTIKVIGNMKKWFS